MGLFGGTRTEIAILNYGMPDHVSCCVPLCTNNFRNSSDVTFYRIPKKQSIRREYVRLLRNTNLKLNSDSTRICSAHWNGGRKLSRSHLPSIFPWSKKNNERRILHRTDTTVDSGGKKRKVDLSSTEMDEVPNPENEVSVLECTLDSNDLPALSFCDAETQTEITGELLDRLEGELKQTGVEKERLAKEKDELTRESKRLQHAVQNPKFDISKFKERDEDVEFYTGLPHWDALMLLYGMLHDKAQNLNYGTYEKKDTGSEQKLGRPRAMSTFEEFTLTLMRLRLGSFQKDLAHRFNVSEATVSTVFNTWVRFMRVELEPLICLPRKEILHQYMPNIFKELYPRTVLIIDAVEIRAESPSSLDMQSVCYSSYKGTTTMKGLVGLSPIGALGFLSELYTGSISDKELTKMSHVIDYLDPGDDVMADKGFDIQDDFAAKGVTVNIPSFLKGKTQFSKEEMEHNKKIASLRIHVERCIERMKNWHMFDSRIPITLAPVASDMFIIIGALTNFLPPLID